MLVTHIEIKDSYKCITLDISLIFFSLEKMVIISSDPKDNLGISVKGLITSLGVKAKTSPKKYKNPGYDIVNVSMRDLSKIIREFEILPYKFYYSRSPIHEPTDSYVYLAIQLVKCMMRADDLNLHVYLVVT